MSIPSNNVTPPSPVGRKSKLPLILALIGGAVAVAGVAAAVLLLRQDPADAVDSYLTALDEGDIAALKESSCQQMSGALDRDSDSADAIKRNAEKFSATWKILDQRLVDVKSAVTVYDVEVEITTVRTGGDPQTEIETLRVVDEDGAWRVCR